MTALVTEPSICIPRTLNNVTWQQVKSTFEQLLGRGTVERVDIVPSKANDPQPFCRIFVHFRYWPNTEDATAIRDRLVSGEVIKVVYDNPWFWKCSASRVPKPDREGHKKQPYIEYTGETSRYLVAETSEQSTPPPVEQKITPPHVLRQAAARARRVSHDVSDCNGVEKEKEVEASSEA